MEVGALETRRKKFPEIVYVSLNANVVEITWRNPHGTGMNIRLDIIFSLGPVFVIFSS